MDGSDAFPILENEVVVGSVASSGEWKLSVRLCPSPECKKMAANEPDGYWQRRENFSVRVNFSLKNIEVP